MRVWAPHLRVLCFGPMNWEQGCPHQHPLGMSRFVCRSSVGIVGFMSRGWCGDSGRSSSCSWCCRNILEASQSIFMMCLFPWRRKPGSSESQSCSKKAISLAILWAASKQQHPQPQKTLRAQRRRVMDQAARTHAQGLVQPPSDDTVWSRSPLNACG